MLRLMKSWRTGLMRFVVTKSSWRRPRINSRSKTPKGNARKFNEKECGDCGVIFMPKSGTQLYCSKCGADRYAGYLLKIMDEDAY